jgi:hypothetical protein
MLVFVLVLCCCCCLHRLRCRFADAADAAVDTKCTAAIAVTIAPAVTAAITNVVALTAAIAALIASAVTPCCNHCRLAVAVAVAVAVARVVARLVAMSGRRQWCTCAASVEGRRSHDNVLLGLCCLARLALLGSLCSACIKVRLLTHWLTLCAHNAGRKWGEAAALAAVTMATTHNNQLKGAAEETMVAALVTGSGEDCDSGNDGGGEDDGCGDGDGSTDGGSGSIDGDSEGGEAMVQRWQW